MDVLEAISELKKYTWAQRYFDYLSLRQKGLNKAAQAINLEFFNDYHQQSKESKRSFINSIYSAAFNTGDSTLFLPYNLYKLVQADLNDWIDEEPDNPIPYRWSENSSVNMKGVELDPSDQIALRSVFNSLMGKIAMNQHEVGFGFPYDGNPAEDLKYLAWLEKHLENLDSDEEREKLREQLNDLKEVALKDTNRSA